MLDLPYHGVATQPEKHFKDSLGAWRASEAVNAQIKFSKAIGSFVKERRWHSSQVIDEHSDGSITVSLRGSVSRHTLYAGC